MPLRLLSWHFHLSKPRPRPYLMDLHVLCFVQNPECGVPAVAVCDVAGRPDIAAHVRRSGVGLVVYYSERMYTEQKTSMHGNLISDFHFFADFH